MILGGAESEALGPTDSIFVFDLNLFEANINYNNVACVTDAEKFEFEWIKLKTCKMTRPLSMFSYAMTQDEKYFVVFYGKELHIKSAFQWENRYSKMIEILDLTEMKWFTSKMTIPPKSLVDYSTFSDDSKGSAPVVALVKQMNKNEATLLVDGYIRRLSLKLFVPDDIVSILVSILQDADEYVHLLQQSRCYSGQSANHFRISLKALFNGLI